MTKEAAAELIALAQKISIDADRMAQISRNINGDSLSGQVFSCAGDVIGLLTMQVIFPIVKLFPDLDPDN